MGQGWSRPGRQAAGVHAGVLALYAALTLLLTWPLALNLSTAIPGDGFDGWQNYWNLWWLKTALVERVQSPVVTDLLYYPTGVSLYFHTLNPFNGVVSLPVQLSGGLLLAYNFVVLLSFALSGYGAFLLALWVLRGARLSRTSLYGAAFIAGAIFTFAPFHFAHLLGHMQVFAYQWIPFTVLYLLRALDAHLSTSASTRRAGQGWLRPALMAGVFLTLACLCDWYFGLYLGLFAGLAALWYWVTRAGKIGWWNALWRAFLPAATAGVVAAFLLLPMLAPMVREAVQYDFMVRPESDLYILSAAAVDFVVPNRMHALAPEDGFAGLGNQIAPISERTIALGWTALLLALIGLARDWRRALPWTLAALFFALLAMGPRLHWLTIGWEQIPEAGVQDGGWSLYGLLNELVPFMRISRSVSRFALMVQLCIGIGAAIGIATFLRRANRSAAIGIPLILTCLIVAETWSVPYPLSPPDTPPFYAQIGQQRSTPAPRVANAPDFSAGVGGAPVQPGALLNLPMNYDRPGYLLYQTIHGMPLTVAYISRDDPRTLTERVPVLQQLRHLGDDIIAVEIGAVGKTVLHDLGVSIVTLDRYKMPGGLEREYTEAVAAAIFGNDAPIYQDDRLTAYAVAAPEVLAPYLALGALYWGPLQVDSEGSVLGRALGAGAAALMLRHTVGEQSLVISYSSAAPVEVRNTETGALIATLPASDSHRTEVVPLGMVVEVELLGPGAIVSRLALR